eukprot:11012061-Karenia_brevis.AAC.1
MFLAEGPNHGRLALQAMELSKTFFADIGARIAEKKCFLSSTCPVTRKVLRNMNKVKEEGKIPVVNHYRDLGFHLCLDKSKAATTSTQRMIKGSRSARRLRNLPLPKGDKIQIVQANLLPGGLYGIEGAMSSKSALQSFQAAIADVVGARSARSSQIGAFE